MDSLTHFFANNVVLTLLIVGFVLFMMIPRGGGGGIFSSGIVRVIVLAVIFLVFVPACVRSLDDSWEDWKAEAVRDAPGFVQWLLCRIVRMEAACTILQMSQAPDAATQRRMDCIERKVSEHPNEGARAKDACGLRTDPDIWEACMQREFDEVPSLQGELIECSASSPTQWGPFWRDVIEPIACPLGIKSWCQTGSDATPYVYDGPYLQCLSDVVARHGTNASSCSTITDPKTWDDCMVAVIKAGLPAPNATYWLDQCDRIRASQR